MRGIGKGVFSIAVGPANAVNVYLIEGPDGNYTLVDAAIPGLLPTLRRGMARRGVPLERIVRVLVTHAHPDHIGGLPELLAVLPVPIWIHAEDAPFARGEQRQLLPPTETLTGLNRQLSRVAANGSQPAVPIARILTGGEVLNEVYPGLTVVHLPGHSPGHSGFSLPDQHLLLGGDVVMHMLPWRLTLPMASFTPNMLEAKRSIGTVAAMDVHTLGIGHGPPLVGNAAAYLDALVQRVGESPPAMSAA